MEYLRAISTAGAACDDLAAEFDDYAPDLAEQARVASAALLVIEDRFRGWTDEVDRFNERVFEARRAMGRQHHADAVGSVPDAVQGRR